MHEKKVGRVAVLLSGRGSNFNALYRDSLASDSGYRVVLVVSDNRDAPGLRRAREHGLETVFLDPELFCGRPAFSLQLVKELEARKVDLVCLAGFMRILGRRVVDAYGGRILNIHPALLPAFPGLNAQRRALEYGVKCSGCTVHFVDRGMDTGPIVLQECVEVCDSDNEDSLSRRILEMEHQLFPRAVRLFFAGVLHLQGRRVRIK
ncbi:MAG TPA: phosphoribosylglycinamide formyltransferase [Candidatus Aminicenantes bacterium]|nr:phosphoribosylglycinamide formyltransferase [Candidatus Aminicenantes bacterium]